MDLVQFEVQTVLQNTFMVTSNNYSIFLGYFGILWWSQKLFNIPWMIDAFFENVQPGCISALLLYKANFREGLNTEKKFNIFQAFLSKTFFLLKLFGPCSTGSTFKKFSVYLGIAFGRGEREGGTGGWKLFRQCPNRPFASLRALISSCLRCTPTN